MDFRVTFANWKLKKRGLSEAQKRVTPNLLSHNKTWWTRLATLKSISSLQHNSTLLRSKGWIMQKQYPFSFQQQVDNLAKSFPSLTRKHQQKKSRRIFMTEKPGDVLLLAEPWQLSCDKNSLCSRNNLVVYGFIGGWIKGLLRLPTTTSNSETITLDIDKVELGRQSR